MTDDWRQQLRHARRIPFPKLAIVAVIAGAALASACSQPSDTQQAQQQQQGADEQARKEADEKAWADAEKTGTAAAYTAYLQNFGSGAHVSEASQRIVALNETARKAAAEKAWPAAREARAPRPAARCIPAPSRRHLLLEAGFRWCNLCCPC